VQGQKYVTQHAVAIVERAKEERLLFRKKKK